MGGRGEGEEVERGRRERGGGEEDAMEGVGRSKEEDEGGEGSLFFLPLSDSSHLPSSLPPTFTPSLLLLLPLILTPLNFSPFIRHSSLIHGSNKGKTKSKTPIPSLKNFCQKAPGFLTPIVIGAHSASYSIKPESTRQSRLDRARRLDRA